MGNLYALAVFVGITFVGGGLVALVSFVSDKQSPPKRSVFSVGRYVLLTIFPLISTAVITLMSGTHILYIFLVSAVFGTAFEFFVGFITEITTGSSIWVYKHYRIGKHTSFLVVPWWGFAGLFFWLVAETLTQFGF